ncbi:GNAT family N-acetyltransferase [Rhizobium sp. AG855]|uniref:GNAT family N-acetyltransferase n=1 Tax=Rhizobium sp. AG855 TaxID=2183898 RepID=UPI000E746B07|nr:GNAT family N-acetyltransferase [Rhizobium sp. AG855]RKE86077.1 hypothetical protein DFO46_2882 [Rhizobium sp. AG855]
MSSYSVSLTTADPSDLADFKRELQDAFAIAVIEEFEALPDGPIPSDEDLDTSFNNPGAEVLRIVCDGRKVGGAVVTIDEKTHHNSLDLFFLKVGEHGLGLGHKAWLAIEARYPQTIVWTTHTPYFERRNIHFYVNKCGFKITAFFHAHYPDPNHPEPDNLPDSAGFQFEKVM